jgi:hypothetical protein
LVRSMSPMRKKIYGLDLRKECVFHSTKTQSRKE